LLTIPLRLAIETTSFPERKQLVIADRRDGAQACDASNADGARENW